MHTSLWQLPGRPCGPVPRQSEPLGPGALEARSTAARAEVQRAGLPGSLPRVASRVAGKAVRQAAALGAQQGDLKRAPQVRAGLRATLPAVREAWEDRAVLLAPAGVLPTALRARTLHRAAARIASDLPAETASRAAVSASTVRIAAIINATRTPRITPACSALRRTPGWAISRGRSRSRHRESPSPGGGQPCATSGASTRCSACEARSRSARRRTGTVRAGPSVSAAFLVGGGPTARPPDAPPRAADRMQLGRAVAGVPGRSHRCGLRPRMLAGLTREMQGTGLRLHRCQDRLMIRVAVTRRAVQGIVGEMPADPNHFPPPRRVDR